MIAANTKKQVELFVWYKKIVADMPSSSNLLYDLEAEYQGEAQMLSFLVNSAHFVASEPKGKHVLSALIENHIKLLQQNIAKQEELYDIILSASDSRLCRIIKVHDWEVIGDERRLLLFSVGNNKEVTLHLELAKSGYSIVTLKYGNRMVDSGSQAELTSLIERVLDNADGS